MVFNTLEVLWIVWMCRGGSQSVGVCRGAVRAWVCVGGEVRVWVCVGGAVRAWVCVGGQSERGQLRRAHNYIKIAVQELTPFLCVSSVWWVVHT